ncbi:hypothetical protein LTR37_017222 [Vermiconidia calcicola]|uniref:Uncharacterized protein n=1 Tax=Vermiconidia calcicola TaxID=1690605 RepID=A0ACC3MLL6_9PEZI|nr:hypothetical protein LTR37_017222 [Vermiconidia calcicola]
MWSLPAKVCESWDGSDALSDIEIISDDEDVEQASSSSSTETTPEQATPQLGSAQKPINLGATEPRNNRVVPYERAEDQITIEDFGSMHGTRVNGIRLGTEANQPRCNEPCNKRVIPHERAEDQIAIEYSVSMHGTRVYGIRLRRN